MATRKKIIESDDDLVASWPIPLAARLGSSVRSRGIYLEARARLPAASRKALTIIAGDLFLRMPKENSREFDRASAVVAATLEDIESLPVIPREIEDILSIKTSERHRWLKDGRLPSAGTRTVKLRGRAKKITFHVFDPRIVEDILDQGLVDEWREQDVEQAAENRRQAAWKAKLKRAERKAAADPATPSDVEGDNDRFKLRGWAEFERDGLLR